MQPPTLFGSGGKPDIQDLNGPEVTPPPSLQIAPLSHAENRRSHDCCASHPVAIQEATVPLMFRASSGNQPRCYKVWVELILARTK